MNYCVMKKLLLMGLIAGPVLAFGQNKVKNGVIYKDRQATG
jgi:hypothetical protein